MRPVREWWQRWGSLLVLGGAILLLGNLKSAFLPQTQAGSVPGLAAGLGIAAIALSLARVWLRLSGSEMGLHRRGFWPSLGFGFVLILVAMLLVSTALRIAAWLGWASTPDLGAGDLDQITGEELRRRISLLLPMDTILPEEIIFRGVLLAEARRRFGSGGSSLLVTALLFSGWHLEIGLRESDGDWPVLGLKLAAYLLGSLLFTLPLLRTGNIAGCMLAHWLADAVLMLVGNPAGGWLKATLLP